MSAIYKSKLPMEQRAKDERDQNNNTWNSGCYNFLLQRTHNHYHHKKPTQRRLTIQKHLQKSLPLLNDEVLLSLYKHACQKHTRNCFAKYENAGFQMTPSEKSFLKTLESVISINSEFRFLEVYPSLSHNKDLYPNQKMVIGSYVPDFIVFGLKSDGYSSVVFEINGDSHHYKASKDELRDQHLATLGILSLPIDNSLASNYSFLESTLRDLIRTRSGALDEQIKRHKRKLWCKTIACHMSLHEIDSFISYEFALQASLYEEATLFRQLFKDQRKINKELEKCL